MLRSVIVGVDGRQGGRDAIALARRLAPHADLVLACVYPFEKRDLVTDALGWGAAMHDECRARVERDREAAGLQAARIVMLPDHSSSHALHDLAAREAADLLVLGASHRSMVGRAVLGDVSRAVLHGAPCPVAIAPRHPTPRAMTTVGVAYDGSAESDAALLFAASIAAEQAARLVVCRVTQDPLGLVATPGLGYAYDTTEVHAGIRRQAETATGAALTRLGIDEHVEIRVSHGPLYPMLDELSAGVDLLVCGSRRSGRIHQVVLGSTSDHLMHHAPCPVVVVPRPAAPQEPRQVGHDTVEVG